MNLLFVCVWVLEVVIKVSRQVHFSLLISSYNNNWSSQIEARAPLTHTDTQRLQAFFSEKEEQIWCLLIEAIFMNFIHSVFKSHKCIHGCLWLAVFSIFR